MKRAALRSSRHYAKAIALQEVMHARWEQAKRDCRRAEKGQRQIKWQRLVEATAAALRAGEGVG